MPTTSVQDVKPYANITGSSEDTKFKVNMIPLFTVISSDAPKSITQVLGAVDVK